MNKINFNFIEGVHRRNGRLGTLLFVSAGHGVEVVFRYSHPSLTQTIAESRLELIEVRRFGVYKLNKSYANNKWFRESHAAFGTIEHVTDQEELNKIDELKEIGLSNLRSGVYVQSWQKKWKDKKVTFSK